MNGIIYQGGIVTPSIPIAIIDARQKYGNEYWWDPKGDPKNCRIRTDPILGAVIHHQGGEGSANTMFNLLKARPKKDGGASYLSVHFEIDQKGAITQLADLGTVCQHAGEANNWSWGVEIANNGMGKSNAKWPRANYSDEMHGVKVQYLAFYDSQMEACLKLIKAVHQILGLKTRIATGDTGKTLRRVLTRQERTNYEVFAHFHLTVEKMDPSPHLMDYLAAAL